MAWCHRRCEHLHACKPLRITNSDCYLCDKAFDPNYRYSCIYYLDEANCCINIPELSELKPKNRS